MKERNRRMCLAGLFTALVYLLTAFLSIPYPGHAGYLNLGDMLIMLAAFLLGPRWGVLIGVIGSGLADLTLGYPIYLPFTFLAKGGEALIVGLLTKKRKHRRLWPLVFLCASLFMVLGYLPAYLLIDRTLSLCSVYDLVQALIATLLTSILAPLLDHQLSKARMIKKEPDDERKDRRRKRRLKLPSRQFIHRHPGGHADVE